MTVANDVCVVYYRKGQRSVKLFDRHKAMASLLSESDPIASWGECEVTPPRVFFPSLPEGSAQMRIAV